MPSHTHTGRGINIRALREVRPGEFASFIACLQAIAKRQDGTPPAPQRARA